MNFKTLGYSISVGNDNTLYQVHLKAQQSEIVHQFEKQDLQVFIQKCRSAYPDLEQNKAILATINKAINDFVFDNNIDRLNDLFFNNLQNQQNRNSLDSNSSQLKLEENNVSTESNLKIDTQADQQHIKNEAIEIVESVHEKQLRDDSVRFHRNIAIKNTGILRGVSQQKNAVENILSNVATRNKLFAGLRRANIAVSNFVNNPHSIKNMIDLYHTKIFYEVTTPAEKYIEDWWQNHLKLAYLNEYLTIKNDQLVYRQPSGNREEFLAYQYARFLEILRSPIKDFKDFFNNLSHSSAYSGVRHYYTEVKGMLGPLNAAERFDYYGPGFFNNILGHEFLKIYSNIRNSILDNITTYPAFEHVLKINNLCNQGNLVEAKVQANPSSALEKELISTYQLKQSTQEQQPQLSQKQEFPKIIDKECINTAKASEKSLFPVNPYAVYLMQSYGQDIKEICDFKDATVKQLINHDHLVKSINKLAERIFISSDVTEQSLALNMAYGFLQAIELNFNDQLADIQKNLIIAEKIADTTLKIATEFLSRLAQNSRHPVNYIHERVASTMQLGCLLVDYTLQQLFTSLDLSTPYYWQETVKLINDHAQRFEGESKTIETTVGHILADLIFDGGIGVVAKATKSFVIENASNIAHKVAKTIEGISEAVQKEKQVTATTPEGVKIVLKAEADQATKQGVKQAIKVADKMEQGAVKEVAKQTPQTPVGKIEEVLVNQSPAPLFKDGFVEVNGFKFTEFYFRKLYAKGRPVPGLFAKEILENAIKVIPDPKGAEGFFKYFTEKWEMVYNPVTKRVLHICILKTKK